jgi:drug/metabolite transporter (DMT)-like permease
MVGAYSCIFGGLACLPFLPFYGAALMADIPLKAHATYLFLGLISTAAGYLVWAYALAT